MSVRRDGAATTHVGGTAALVVAATLLAAAVLLVACSGSQGGALAGVEIRNYRGQKLSSVNDFVENSIRGPQHVDIATYRLRVDGDVSRPATYTYGQVLSQDATYTKVVQLDCVEGWSVKLLWEGVLLADLIDRSQPSADATAVVFHGVDGYTTSLPLDFVRSRRILLAYKMNGVTIPEIRGYPFMVVAEDHWGYKWAKWVTRIELSADPDYRGYWEQRGYSQNGSRSQSFYGTGP